MATITHPLLERYREKLAALPAAGGGGCHPALLGVASLGVMCGIPAHDIFRDLREQVHGDRVVPDREIQDAIDKAAREHAAGAGRASPCPRRPSPPVAPRLDGPGALRRIVEEGRGATEADLRGRSPVQIDWPTEQDAVHVIDALYQPEDVLFIGTREGRPMLDQNIRRAGDWVVSFRERPPGPRQPHIIPNPLSGKPGPRADGRGETLRGDACVAGFRFAVVEFDTLPREDQLAFWLAARLPVVALVDSGGKSVHGWVKVRGIECATDWTRVVEQHLFGNLLEPLGVDPACKNESRLSRLPGHFRTDKGAWQRLLYLAPEGKAVAA